jgi:hypothetical protein
MGKEEREEDNGMKKNYKMKSCVEWIRNVNSVI